MDLLLESLSQLESAQLIRRALDEPLSYLFKHTLTHESAYESLLVKRRREIHRRVAEAYERVYADRLDEFAPLLAQQYGNAGDDAKTLEYAVRAGDGAARVYANAEAITFYTQGLNLAGRLQGNSELLLRLYIARGRAFELFGDYEQALANYDDMARVAQERHDTHLELVATMARATIHSAPTAKFDAPVALVLSEQALALARQMKDRAAEAKILWNLMLLSYFTFRLTESVEFGEKSLAIAREFDLREQLAYTLNDIQRSYLALHQLERAQSASMESRELWRELDNKPMLIDNLAGSAQVFYLDGDYDQVLNQSDTAYRLSQSIGNLWGQSYSLLNSGLIYWERGEMQKALETMEECSRLGEQAGFLIATISQPGQMGLIYATLGNIDRGFDCVRRAAAIGEKLDIAKAVVDAMIALLYVWNGELDRAELAVRESHSRIDQTTDLTTGVISRVAAGELALAQHDYDLAVRIADELLDLLREWGARPFLTDGLLIKSRALVAQGHLNDAYVSLTRARAEAEAVGSRRTLWQILKILSELEMGRGNYAAAADMNEQARQVIDFIAAHSPADLRASFLNLPQVRQVQEAARHS